MQEAGDLNALDLGLAETEPAGAARSQPGHALGVTMEERHLHIDQVAERRRYLAQLDVAALDYKSGSTSSMRFRGSPLFASAKIRRGSSVKAATTSRVKDDAGPRAQGRDGRVDSPELAEEGGDHGRPGDPRGDGDVVTPQSLRCPASDP